MESQEKNDKASEVEEKTAPQGTVVYEAIRKEGEHELERTTPSLAWSGLAAGLSMGFSMLGKAILREHLPDAHWERLVVSFGYSFGFLIIVLGRQQLFTENTLTVILPFLKKKKAAMLANIGRLWAVVLAANLVGTFIFALVMARTNAVNPALRETMKKIGEESMSHDFGTTLLRGIFAGWLIALMVWLLPFAEQLRVVVIILITYLVGIGEFPHVIAGAAEVFFLSLHGDAGFGEVLGRYVLPTLIGNILGGVTLVALLGYMQHVAHEDEDA